MMRGNRKKNCNINPRLASLWQSLHQQLYLLLKEQDLKKVPLVMLQFVKILKKQFSALVEEELFSAKAGVAGVGSSAERKRIKEFLNLTLQNELLKLLNFVLEQKKELQGLQKKIEKYLRSVLGSVLEKGANEIFQTLNPNNATKISVRKLSKPSKTKNDKREKKQTVKTRARPRLETKKQKKRPI